MRTTRTFVAVEVPEAEGAKLTRLQSLLAPEVPGVRWSTIPPFHATLAFLGDVDDTELNNVCRAVERAVAGFSRLSLRLEGLGAFPDPTRARTVWVGLSGAELPAFLNLQRAIAAAVAETGYPTDESFRPHVTIGRAKQGRGPRLDLSPQMNHYRTWSAGSFGISEIITFASTSTRDGTVYAPLARAPLGRGKPKSAP
jgi:RNA 2',3'-cyclic 3'-phosphodiesterase